MRWTIKCDLIVNKTEDYNIINIRDCNSRPKKNQVGTWLNKFIKLS